MSNDAWLSRPLAENQAAAVSTFDDFITDFSFTQNGVRLHYLPYPINPVDTDTFERFYTEVYLPLREATDTDAEFVDRIIEIYTSDVDGASGGDNPASPLSEIIDEDTEYQPFTQETSWLHLYALMYVGSTEPSRVFVDEPNVSLDAVTSVEGAYIDVLSDVGASQLFGTLASQLGYYLPNEGGIAYALLFGSLFDPVIALSPDENDTEAEDAKATTGDALFTRYAKLLRGRSINAVSLISEFATRVDEKLRENLSTNNEPFPTRLVLSQYIQLRTLDQAELLDGDSIIKTGICNADMRSPSDGQTYSSRDERLQDFLENHPMLDNTEARSVFLLGALVGRLSAYQYSEGVSQKLTEQYPPSSISRRVIPEVTQEILDRNYTYGDKDDINRFNQRYTNRLADSMLVRSPDDWTISESESKWLYALGVAYGKQDTSKGIERSDEIEDDDDGTDEVDSTDETDDGHKNIELTEY
ncbi:MAG: CRISPR-associated protein TM1802 (cas_TM1802) [Haloquadratum walsbyi J07HQW1]|uniref:CRISPR-associated protein TM1802 (Cas_TM1802) n=1 Tax=Haloquadratum walsbyi J07HQW1 TaxID=1238424 RepID=U1PGI6_9EURY|nr:MAG: CRISPR-associated protein TM1802 (cas_TM1802) [Haloquadratum walsbyi J07HQW1]